MGSIARRIAALGPSDADARLWAASVIANGGSVSVSRLSIVSRFIVAEKASGAWALTDDYLALWGENAPQALTSLKQRRLATAVNSPTFTPSEGYALNGLTNYVDTGFVPSTHGINLTAANQRIGVYERTNVSGNTSAAGARSAAANSIQVRPRSATTTLTGIMGGAIGTFTIAADSRGYSVVSWTSADSTMMRGCKNGVRLSNATGLTIPSAIPTFSFFIGGTNQNGALSVARATTNGLTCVGAQMSDAQELAQYNAIQAWATSIGANV